MLDHRGTAYKSQVLHIKNPVMILYSTVKCDIGNNNTGDYYAPNLYNK